MDLGTVPLPRLAALIYNQCHLVLPSVAEAILAALEGRIGDIRIVMDGDVEASSFAGRPALDANRKTKGYRLTDRGAAIVPVSGELVNRGAWLGASSGLTSYEGLRHTLRQAAADPAARGLVLDIDSPGGQASGMTETAALVRSIGESKPVIAVANSLAASAAYGIASAANKLVVNADGAAGSIGVVYVHADRSRQIDRQGITVTILTAGARKKDGNSLEPLSDESRGEIQRRIDAVHAIFVDTVRQGRPQLTEKAIRTTEARVYLGAEAVRLGLADEVGTFDQAVAEAEAGTVRVRSRVPAAATPTEKGSPMPAPQSAPAVAAAGPGWEGMTLSELNAAVAQLRATLADAPAEAEPAAAASQAQTPAAPAAAAPAKPAADAAAIAEAEARGRTAERERIRTILAHDEARERPVQAQVLALESEVPVAQAAAMLAKMPKEQAAAGSRTSRLYDAIAASGGDPRVRHQEPASASAAGGSSLEEMSNRMSARFGAAAKKRSA